MKQAAVVVKVFWLPVIVCGLLACSGLYLIPGLLHSECEMTYMYTRPQYQKLNLSLKLQRNFPQYSLHLYSETRNREEPTLDWTPLRLRGLPALFIPGNAGSHKQGKYGGFLVHHLHCSSFPSSSSFTVRSSASIALQMHRREFPKLRHFDFFTVNLNEEFSGSFGGVLHQQTGEVIISGCVHFRHLLLPLSLSLHIEFVAASIDHILSLYSSSPSPPSSVLIIAHSMGGVVAQALFTLPTFPSSHVSTIVTLSSPLAKPVIVFDPTLLQFYNSIAEVCVLVPTVCSTTT